MKIKFQEIFITNILLIIGKVISFFGFEAAGAFGKILGNVFYLISPSRRRITFNNLSKAFPEKALSGIEIISKKSFQNLGIVLLESLVFRNMDDDSLKNLIEYKNIDMVRNLHARGKGLILLSGHYGNWEILAYSAGIFTGIPCTIIVKPQKNKYFDNYLNKFRTRSGNKIVSMYKAAMTIVKTIRKGETVALLADQSASKDKDVFVDFFGRPASTFESPAALALKFETPIIMGFAERQNDGRYMVELKEIPHDDLEDTTEGILELTKRHVRELENQIRKKPELWAWQHRRWKHQPPGVNNEKK